MGILADIINNKINDIVNRKIEEQQMIQSATR